MPKRKAPSTPGGAAGRAGSAVKSPNARKKSKKEALAAAKEWHDKHGNAGVGTDEEVVNDVNFATPSGGNRAVAQQVASPAGSGKSKKEALAAAKEWHDKRRKSGVASPPSDRAATQQVTKPTDDDKKLPASAVAVVNQVVATTQQMPDHNSSQPSLFDSLKANSNNGGSGNAFLQSLRKNSNGSKEAESSESPNGTPSIPTIEAVPSSSSVSNDAVVSAGNVTTMNNGRRSGRKIDFVEVILVFIFLALNVFAAIYINDQQSLNNNFHEQHLLEVEKIKAEIFRSREVESILQSGIDVLEQAQMKRYAVKDLSAVPNLYHIQLDQNENIQSQEEKADWLKGIQLLETGMNSALRDLDVKLMGLGIEGGKEKIMGIDDKNK